jgi:hypothetical protein
MEDIKQFSEVPYLQVFNDLLYMIQNDVGHCPLGEEVSGNIQAILADIDT